MHRALSATSILLIMACSARPASPPLEAGAPAAETVKTERTASAEPLAVLLTWQRAPTTTMTVDWHVPQAHPGESTLFYRSAGSEESWASVSARRVVFPASDRRVHRAEIAGLSPDSTYELRVGEHSRVYLFRTMPESLDQRPVRFAAGGDTMHDRGLMEQTNRVAMQHDPDFVVWGGDLAYANGDLRRVDRWHDWTEAVHQTLRTPEGRLVPVLAGIGNHEVDGSYVRKYPDYEPTDAWRTRLAPFYYQLFAFPGQPGYGALDFGDYLSVILLDTGHSNPIEGAQTTFLERALAERRERQIPTILPVYHVPGYPSHRSPDGRLSTEVREHWVPLFEQYGIELALENHDHTYKRTHRLKGGVPDESGVLYVGDGAWGVGTRAGKSSDETYIDTFEAERHAILVTLGPGERSARVVSDGGRELDAWVW